MVGTPYLFEQFQSGSIFLKSGGAITDAKLNIDAYAQEIVTLSNSVEKVVNKMIVDYVTINMTNDSVARFAPTKNGILLNILNVGESKLLYKKFEKRIIRGMAGNGYTEATKDKLVDTSNYVLVIGTDTLIFQNAKDLIKVINDVFPDKAKKIDLPKKKTGNEISRIADIIYQLER